MRARLTISVAIIAASLLTSSLIAYAPRGDGQAPPPAAPKPDAPKPDAPKPDAPKPDAPKPDAPKPDAPKPPAPPAPKPDPKTPTPPPKDDVKMSKEYWPGTNKLKYVYEMRKGPDGKYARNGAAKAYYDNGVMEREGNYKQGVRVGQWKYYDDKGKLLRVEDRGDGTGPDPHPSA